MQFCYKYDKIGGCAGDHRVELLLAIAISAEHFAFYLQEPSRIATDRTTELRAQSAIWQGMHGDILAVLPTGKGLTACPPSNLVPLLVPAIVRSFSDQSITFGRATRRR
jgi:hypothetical protein